MRLSNFFRKSSPKQRRHKFGPNRGSLLLAHNVNLAPIKASVGTSLDNRKSLFNRKHPVVGPGVDDPCCCTVAERHMVAVTEPRILSSDFVRQSVHHLKINKYVQYLWARGIISAERMRHNSISWYVLKSSVSSLHKIQRSLFLSL